MKDYKCPICGSTEIRQQRVNDLFGAGAFGDLENIATDDLQCCDCGYFSEASEFTLSNEDEDEDEDD